MYISKNFVCIYVHPYEMDKKFYSTIIPFVEIIAISKSGEVKKGNLSFHISTTILEYVFLFKRDQIEEVIARLTSIHEAVWADPNKIEPAAVWYF